MISSGGDGNGHRAIVAESRDSEMQRLPLRKEFARMTLPGSPPGASVILEFRFFRVSFVSVSLVFDGACKPSAITASRRLAGLSARVGSVRVVSGLFDACPFAMGWHPAMHLPAETKRLLDDSEELFGFYAKLCGHAAHRCGGSEMSSSVAIGTARNRMKNTNRRSITILTLQCQRA